MRYWYDIHFCADERSWPHMGGSTLKPHIKLVHEMHEDLDSATAAGKKAALETFPEKKDWVNHKSWADLSPGQIPQLEEICLKSKPELLSNLATLWFEKNHALMPHLFPAWDKSDENCRKTLLCEAFVADPVALASAMEIHPLKPDAERLMKRVMKVIFEMRPQTQHA